MCEFSGYVFIRGGQEFFNTAMPEEAQDLKTYTRWWNSYLEPLGDRVEDLCEQIQSGVLPFRLLEVCAPTRCTKSERHCARTAM
jgi:hypothetical protein